MSTQPSRELLAADSSGFVRRFFHIGVGIIVESRVNFWAFHCVGSDLFNAQQLFAQRINPARHVVVVLFDAPGDEIDHPEKQQHLGDGCD